MEVKLGKDKILAFRKLKEAGTKTAAKLAFQVEHTLNYERSNDSTMTKDGAVINPGGLESTLEISALASNDPLNRLLMESVIDGDKLEIWEIDLSNPVDADTNEYNALYMRGNLNSWALPAPTEGPVEIDTTADIDGKPQEGTVIFTADQMDEVQYAFRDLEPVTG